MSMNAFVGDYNGTMLSKSAVYNNYYVYLKGTSFNNPGASQTWVFMDEHPDSINDGTFVLRMPLDTQNWDDVPASYHNGACGLSFADGHAEIHKWKDSITIAPVRKLRPAYPTGKLSPSDHAWLAERTTALK